MTQYRAAVLKANDFLDYQFESSRSMYAGSIEERFLVRGKENGLTKPQLVASLSDLMLDSGREKHKFLAECKSRKLLNPTNSEKNDWNLDLCTELAMKIIFKDRYETRKADNIIRVYDPRIEEPETLEKYGITNEEIEQAFLQKPKLASSLVVRHDDYGYEGDCYPLMTMILRPRTGLNYPGRLSPPGGHIEDITDATSWEEFVEETRPESSEMPQLDYGQVAKVRFIGISNQVLINNEGKLTRYVNYVFCMYIGNFDFDNWNFTSKTPLDDGDAHGPWQQYSIFEIDKNRELLSPIMKTVIDDIPWLI